jgi:hypothetical protein
MKSSDTRVVRLIAFFKLLKAVLLVVVGVGALSSWFTPTSRASWQSGLQGSG